jgi:hypothetical protein
MALKFCAWLGTIRVIRASSSCREIKSESWLSRTLIHLDQLAKAFCVVLLFPNCWNLLSIVWPTLLQAALAQARSLFALTGLALSS